MFSRIRTGGSKVPTFHSICAASAERGWLQDKHVTCLWGGEKGQSVVLQWGWTHFDSIWQMFVTLTSLVCRLWSCLYHWWQISAPSFCLLAFVLLTTTELQAETRTSCCDQDSGTAEKVTRRSTVRFVLTLLHFYVIIFQRAVLDALKRSKSINFWCWLFMV